MSPASVIVLAEFDDPASAALIVEGDLGFVPAEIDDRDAFAAGVRRVRIFAGHAGWGPGQLESELEEDSWIIEPARRGDVFTAAVRGAVVGGAAPQGPRLRAARDDADGPVAQLRRPSSASAARRRRS